MQDWVFRLGWSVNVYRVEWSTVCRTNIGPTSRPNISEPRFESYDPWRAMGHDKLPTRILKVRIFYWKPPKIRCYFCLPNSGTWVHKWVRVKFKVPKYRSRFLITGPGSWVRVKVPKYRSPTRDLFRSRYLGKGSGFRVQVQVPKYGSRFPSTGPGSQVRIWGKFKKKL